MPRFLLYPLVGLFSAVWSSAFVAGKAGTAYLDPYSLLAWRFGLTALILLPLALARRRVGASGDIRTGLVLGLLYNALYLGLAFTALVSVPATAVILIVSCAPFATALFAAAAGQERLDAGRLLGVAAGCGGVAVMALGQPMTTATAFGVGCAVLGMLAFSLGTVVYRGRAGDAVGVNFWQSVAGCGAMIPLSLVFGRPGAAATPELAAAVAYLALVVGVGGMGLWFLLIRVSGAATASAYHLLNPFSGLLLSHLILGTAVTARDVAGVGLTCLGLAVVIGRRASHPPGRSGR